MKYLKYVLSLLPLPLPIFILLCHFSVASAQIVVRVNDFQMDDDDKRVWLEIFDDLKNPHSATRIDSFYNEGLRHRDVEVQCASLFLQERRLHQVGYPHEADSVIDILCDVIARTGQCENILVGTLFDQAYIKMDLGDIRAVAAIAQRIVDMAKDNDNPQALTSGYMLFASVYKARYNNKLRLEMLLKAAELAEKYDYKIEGLQCYVDIATMYDNLGDSANCSTYVEKARSACLDVDDKDKDDALVVLKIIDLAALDFRCLNLPPDVVISKTEEVLADPDFYRMILTPDQIHAIRANYFTAKRDRRNALAHADSIDAPQLRLSAREYVFSHFHDWRRAYMTSVEIRALSDSLQSEVIVEELADGDAQLNNAELRIEAERIKTRDKMIAIYAAAAVLLLGLAAVLLWSYRRRRRLKKQKALLENEVARQTAELREKNNQLEAQNEEISAQKEAIFNQKEEILAQNDMLEKQNKTILDNNKDMTDSIGYASRIQSAILPDMSQFIGDGKLRGAFVIFIPLKTVSGDFYWAKHVADAMVFVCADCTGHGVPGAFMSMIGSTLLTEICQGDSLLPASEILEELDHRLKLQLDQSGGTDVIKDGMDLSIVIYRPAARLAEVSSARRPIYFRHADSLSELKGVKRSIGDRDEVSSRLPFETVSLPVESGDALYVCTDGFQDQFGGLKKDGGAGKRLKNAGVKEWIDDVRGLPIEGQGARLELRIRQWMDGYAQVDDITMLGLQF